MQYRLWTAIWSIVFVPRVPGSTRTCVFLGECDYHEKTIRVLRTLRGKERLDTLIHEMLHAVLPEKDELFINSVATDMATVLWDAGFKDDKKRKSS